jgi:hypothetical protein
VDDRDIDTESLPRRGSSSSSSKSSNNNNSSSNSNNNNNSNNSNKGSVQSAGANSMSTGVPPQTLDLSYIEFIAIAPTFKNIETERERERENLELGTESRKSKDNCDSSSGSISGTSGPGSCGTCPLLQCVNLTGEWVGLIFIMALHQILLLFILFSLI